MADISTAVITHGRQLRARRMITGSDFVLLDTFVYLTAQRDPPQLVVSVNELAKAGGLARSTVTKSIVILIGCGLLERRGNVYRVRVPENGLS